MANIEKRVTKQIASELTKSNAEQVAALIEKQSEILRPVVEGLTAIQLQQLRLVDALSAQSHAEKEREENILLAQKEVVKAIDQGKEEVLAIQREIRQQFTNEFIALKKDILDLRNEIKELNSSNRKRQVISIVLSVLAIAGLAAMYFLI